MVYLASPLGFSEATWAYMEQLEQAIKGAGHDLINPFRLFGPEVFISMSKMKDEKGRKAALVKLNNQVAGVNAESIKQCEILVAVLDGPDVDSGTASEVGYAYGLGKKIIGLRSDIRHAGENEACMVDLQVEYFIHNSGGEIVRSLEELMDAL